MNGVAGLVRFDGRPVEPRLVEKMKSAMAQRGLDGIIPDRASSTARRGDVAKCPGNLIGGKFESRIQNPESRIERPEKLYRAEPH